MVTQDQAAAESGTPAQTDTFRLLSQRLIQHALKAPTEHLSDVGSWHAHIPFAYALMDIHRPRLTVELGVHKGDSYLTFCRGVANHSVDGRIVGVDTWQGDSHAGSYDSGPILSDLKRRHSGHEAYSILLQKTFDDALADIEDGSVDLLHIDGLHTYDAVKHDFDTWRPKLSSRGVVMFHDTQVRISDFGVWRLWAEIKDSAPSYEFPYGHGLGVLAIGHDVPEQTLNLLKALQHITAVEQLPLSELLSLVGNRFAESARVKALTSELSQVRDDWTDERTRGMAEINRLNEILTDERTRGMAEINRLTADCEQLNTRMLCEFNSRASEITRFIAIIKSTPRAVAVRHLKGAIAEVSKLNAQMSETKNSASAELAKLGAQLNEAVNATPRAIVGRQIRKVKAITSDPRAAVRTLSSRTIKVTRTGIVAAGRTMMGILPVGPETKVRIKDRLFRNFGRKLGIERGTGEPETVCLVGDVPVSVLGERCLSLASSARGPSTNVPARSVSIIIPVYNQISYTLACIDSVKENTTDIEYEIIVVDDCSADQMSALLSRRDDIIYSRNKTNLGFIGSCNAGAKRASKEYVCFLNNDTKVLPHWLSALVNTFELHENVGLAGSKLIYPDGRLQEAGGLIWDDGSGSNWGRLKDVSDPRYNYARIADYCSGASILLPRALFSYLDGFDPYYAPAYGEDSDLAFKIRSMGLATIYQPLSQVVHYEGISNGVSLESGVKQHQVVNAQKLAMRWAPYLREQGPNGVNADIVSDRGVVGRILVIDQITPEPDHDAGSITTLEIMRALRDLGHKITFVPCSNFTWLHPYSQLLASLGIESVVLPWATSFTEHLTRFGASYDAVVFFRPQTWADYIDLIRKHAPQARTIYHSSDLHFLREERSLGLAAKEAGNSKSQALEALKQTELDLIEFSDLCIVHSQTEKDTLESLRPDSQVVCFPWIYEPRGSGPDIAAREGLIFVGGYGHPPNVDAANHFIEDIFPLLAGRLPESCQFMAAGSFPPAELQSKSGARIAIPGYVENLEPLLYAARVMVVPLRYGAGIKGKIITALAHGLPVVTTKIGAEGMGLIHEQHVLIADSESDFADAVVRLYSDRNLWCSLQHAGLEYVAQTTSRRAGLQIVEDILRRLKLPMISCSTNGGSSVVPGHSTAFGSRPSLFDLSKLVEAARAVLQPGTAPETIVVPDGSALTCAGAETMEFRKLVTGLTPQTNLIVAADGTDMDALNQLAKYCNTKLPANSAVAIVFAPPRLHADASGYRMMKPFANWELSAIDSPLHERLQYHFEGTHHDNTWLVDKSLTGFPSLPILLMRPR